MSETVIDVRGMSAGYDGRLALERVGLAIRERELVALVGPNGAGKSTLLKVMVGLLAPRAGEVRLFGRAPSAGAERVAYLPQAEELRWDYPLIVEDVVLLGRARRLGIGRRPRTEDRVAARSALDRVGAGYLARCPISELSGGERQRVLLARALVSEARVLLLDEPATGVDPATEEQLMGLLELLVAEGRTVVVSTHDLAGVIAHFGRVICLNGEVVADGPVEILRDADVLRRLYGGHRGGGEPMLVGDEHHA